MLIILYGGVGPTINNKNQMLIDGRATCGYREYAKNFGHIIYMTPQNVSLHWEHSIPDPKNVIEFINKHPDAIVWAIKRNKLRDQQILRKIKNKKIYYSCNSQNMYNEFCNVSLVDTPERIAKNAKLWFKGKDPNYWQPRIKKDFDYILIGRRGDKNELYFLQQLTKKISNKRKILWLGGIKFKKKVKTHHEVTYTKFMPQSEVRDNISLAHVGVLFTQIKTEGFPQTFLEMTMAGVPVIYNEGAPRNKFYFHKSNCRMCHKKQLIETAEELLKNHNSTLCRQAAIGNYSLERSYKHILSLLK